MNARLRSLGAAAAVLASAVASLATSAPPPDWTRDDEVTGTFVITPEDAAKTVRLVVTTHAVTANLAFELGTDPMPERHDTLAETPIVLFVHGVDAAGAASLTHSAYPTTATPEDGYQPLGQTSVQQDVVDEARVVTVAWDPEHPEDRIATTGYGASEQRTERTVLPRATRTVKWRARIHAEGYDDAPAGAAVEIRAE